MKLFKEGSYLQNGFKAWKDIFLFVGRKYDTSEIVFGIKLGPEMGTEHFCSRELSLHFWHFRIGFWLEDTL